MPTFLIKYVVLQKMYQMLSPYYSHCASLLQSDARTFHAAMERWKPDLDTKVRLPNGDKKLPAILVCHKFDLARDPRLPDDFEISRIVHEKGFVPRWIKASAKTGEGINDAFNLVVRYIMAMDSWNPPVYDPDPHLSFGDLTPGGQSVGSNEGVKKRLVRSRTNLDLIGPEAGNDSTVETIHLSEVAGPLDKQASKGMCNC